MNTISSHSNLSFVIYFTTLWPYNNSLQHLFWMCKCFKNTVLLSVLIISVIIFIKPQQFKCRDINYSYRCSQFQSQVMWCATGQFQYNQMLCIATWKSPKGKTPYQWLHRNYKRNWTFDSNGGLYMKDVKSKLFWKSRFQCVWYFHLQ